MFIKWCCLKFKKKVVFEHNSTWTVTLFKNKILKPVTQISLLSNDRKILILLESHRNDTHNGDSGRLDKDRRASVGRLVLNLASNCHSIHFFHNVQQFSNLDILSNTINLIKGTWLISMSHIKTTFLLWQELWYPLSMTTSPVEIHDIWWEREAQSLYTQYYPSPLAQSEWHNVNWLP